MFVVITGHVDVFAVPLTDVAHVCVPVVTNLFFTFVANVLFGPLNPT